MKASSTNFLQINYVAFKTISRREIKRFFRFWMLTLVPPVVTTFLYFLVFGIFMGRHIAMPHHMSYMQFIIPGLIMMAVIYNSYLNVSSSFNLAKNFHHIEEIIVSPVYHCTILCGYLVGGLVRGLVVGCLVTIVSYFFAPFHIVHPLLAIGLFLMISLIFSTAGFINGVFARKFEDINIILVFVLTPLTFLGGVFYNLSQLPSHWRWLAHANPITYLIEAFRYSFFGVSHISIKNTLFVVLLMALVLPLAAFFILEKRLVNK